MRFAHCTGMRRRCRGLSLIEVMVSLTIGLILLAGLVTLLANVSSSRAEIDKSSRQIENGRYAIALLSEEIHHAGYYGEYFALPAAPAALPDPCAMTAANLQNSDALPIQGYDPAVSPTSQKPSCLPSDYLAGTSVLIVRRARTVTTASASLVATRVYIQANNTDTPIIAVGSPATAFTLKDKTDLGIADTGHDANIDPREYYVHIYYISSCDTCTGTNTDTIPTLKRIKLGDGGTRTVEPLVEGIENMQVEYGIDYLPGAPANTDTGLIGDGSPECFVADPGIDPTTWTDPACTSKPGAADPAFWANVVAVRIFLLARNTELTAGYTDSKNYCLKTACSASTDYVTPVDTKFKRHVFNVLVRAVNPSSRRDH